MGTFAAECQSIQSSLSELVVNSYFESIFLCKLKMLPLKMNFRVCLFIGLFNESDDFRSKLYAFLSNFVISANLSFLGIVSIVYCIKNISDVEKATHAFYVIAAALLGLAWNVGVLMQRNTFKKLLLELQRIVTESEYER